MFCSQESDEREIISLRHCYSAQFRLERGIWTCIQLILPALAGYGTPATTLTQQECYNIQKPVVNAILPKMGISRKAHRSVVFGTARYGGLGLEHLAFYQEHIRLQYLIGHIHCNSTTGKLLRSMLDYTQLEYDCTVNILE
jgi:hypothetical protein